MSKIGIYAKLTKKYLLERLTEEEIMAYYTNIPVNNFTLSGNSFKSPLREDIKPTCNYYYNQNGKLRLKDWSGRFDGDIFDIVSELGTDKPFNVRTAQGFQIALNIIAKDFKIHKYKDSEEREKFRTYIDNYNSKIIPKVIKVRPRAFNTVDKRYWLDKYNIDSNLLKRGKVLPVEELYVEGKDGYMHKRYQYKANDPAYAYYGGKEEGIVIWKVYFPLRKNSKMGKFITNKAFVQGMKLIKPARVGIITKSYKDVLCMNSFGLNAISVAAEGIMPTKQTIHKFKSYHDITISLMDYDRAGILMANRLKREEGISPLMFTTGRFNQPNYGVKDFSDFVDNYGVKKTIILINQIVDQYEDQIYYFDRHNYESLKHIK